MRGLYWLINENSLIYTKYALYNVLSLKYCISLVSENGGQIWLTRPPLDLDRFEKIYKYLIITTDDHEIWTLQISDGRSLRQKLVIGEHRDCALVPFIVGRIKDGFDVSSCRH